MSNYFYWSNVSISCKPTYIRYVSNECMYSSNKLEFNYLLMYLIIEILFPEFFIKYFS